MRSAVPSGFITREPSGCHQVLEPSASCPLEAQAVRLGPTAWPCHKREGLTHGPTLPRVGTYHVVIFARDQFGQETLSAPVPLHVQQAVPPPLAPSNVQVSPSTAWRNGGFTVTWERVVNPKIWTEYRVQVHNHQAFGFGLSWASGSTPNLSVTDSGPSVPRASTVRKRWVSPCR